MLQTNPPSGTVIERAVAAENLGFNYLWTFDSHVLWQEPFVIFSRILAATERLIVGPMVTNPGTRDWTVLASLFATLNEMYGPRTVCGMGRGDSALRYIGRTPTTLETTAAATRVIKDLVAGKTVDYNGKELTIPWVGRRLGPAGVDGCLRTQGPGLDRDPLRRLHPATWPTPRSSNGPSEWCGKRPRPRVATRLTDDLCRRPGLRGRRPCPSARPGALVRGDGRQPCRRPGRSLWRFEQSAVPQALTDYIKAREGYDYDHHGKAGNPSTDFVPDEIIDRFCLLGPAADAPRPAPRARVVSVSTSSPST